MDFGLFAHSTVPTFTSTPSVSSSLPPTVPGYNFDLSFLESTFLWWCVKLLFGYAVVRDLCFYGIPRVGSMMKKAIETTFPSPFADADDTDEADESTADTSDKPVESTTQVVSEAVDPLQRLRPRVKGGAYHYSSALETALGMKEGDMEKGIRKGIDALGDTAEEVVERVAESALESFLGPGLKIEKAL